MTDMNAERDKMYDEFVSECDALLERFAEQCQYGELYYLVSVLRRIVDRCEDRDDLEVEIGMMRARMEELFDEKWHTPGTELGDWAAKSGKVSAFWRGYDRASNADDPEKGGTG